MRTIRSSDWPLEEFTRDVLPRLASPVVFIGTPGPAQEITVQLQDKKGRVLGYLKYAEKDAACRRLQHERFMLSKLPEDIGPQPMKFGALADGEALLMSVVPGKLVAAHMPPPGDLVDLMNSLVLRPPVPLMDHPWVRHVREHGMLGLEASLEPLASKSWPVVVQHGDCVPWNLLRGSNGKLRAIDWEYGTPNGFPYLDLAHYILQTSALVYRQAPLKAARCAAMYLSTHPKLALSYAEAQALTWLTAYYAYYNDLEDGQSADGNLQHWRRAIWQGRVYDI